MALDHLAGGEVCPSDFRDRLQLEIDFADRAELVTRAVEERQRLAGLTQVLQRDCVVERQVGDIVARQRGGERQRRDEALPRVRVVALN